MSQKTRRVLGWVMGPLAIAATGCSVATVAEATATSSAALATGRTVAEAGGPVACGVRFVSAEAGGASEAGCRSASQPCATIQQAVAAACPGDAVIVGAGTFTENVVVDKPLSILGAGDKTV